jgi:hypothetical protein
MDILGAAADAVRAGGTLVVIGHGGRASWHAPLDDYHFDTPAEVVSELGYVPLDGISSEPSRSYGRPLPPTTHAARVLTTSCTRPAQL